MERLSWHDRERGIILWRFEAHSVYEAVLADLDRHDALIASADHPVVHTIVDLSAVDSLPRDIVASFPDMIRSLPPPRDPDEVIAIVSSRLFVQSILKLFSRFSGYQFAYFRSLDAAHRHLLERTDFASSTDSG